MSKMFFTFKWGRNAFVTDDELKKILLKYYTKTEVDDILKQYVTKIDLAAELLNYAELNYVEQEIERLDTKIDGVEDTLNADIDELGNHVNDNAADIRKLETRVTTNETNISNNNDAIISNKKLLDATVNELKKARLWNILGVWNAETTYKIGDVVGDTETQLLYLSVKEPNLNHPLTEKEYWVQVSGVQQINLDDYYNKSQIDDLISQLRDYINQQNKLLQDQVNTKANKTDVDNIKANYVTTNTTQTISGNKTFSGTTTTGTITVDSGNGITVKSGSTRYKIYGSNNNLVLQNLDNTDFKKIMIANSTGETRNLLDLNDYFSLENKINNFIKSKKIPWNNWTRVNESEHSGYYNATFNYSNTEWTNKTVFSIRIHCKNNSYSIQYGFQQNGSWIDLFIAGNRGFYDNMDYIELFYF